MRMKRRAGQRLGAAAREEERGRRRVGLEGVEEGAVDVEEGEGVGV